MFMIILNMHTDWEKDDWRPGDNKEKYRWYRLGAANGYALAQYHLALM